MLTNRRNPARRAAAGFHRRKSFDGDDHLIARKYAASQARLRHLNGRVHALGVPVLYHLFSDLERGADLRPTLEDYASLNPDFIRAFGGDKFSEPFVLRKGRHP
jgi:hypothetical protein